MTRAGLRLCRGRKQGAVLLLEGKVLESPHGQGCGQAPREDGEEGEGDGGPGCVRPFVQWVVLGLGDLPLVGQVAEAHEPEEGPEGRDADVRQDGLLPVLHAADLREVDVQGQVEQAGEEGEHAHGHAIAAGVGVAVVDAELLALGGAVEVALVHDGAEHHDGEHPGHDAQDGVRLPDQGVGVEGAPGFARSVSTPFHRGCTRAVPPAPAWLWELKESDADVVAAAAAFVAG